MANDAGGGRDAACVRGPAMAQLTGQRRNQRPAVRRDRHSMNLRGIRPDQAPVRWQGGCKVGVHGCSDASSADFTQPSS